MLDVSSTITFLTASGAEAKSPYVREWEGLSKAQFIELEIKYNHAMLKMAHLSAAMARGDSPKPPSTNPVEMRMEIVCKEGDVKWMRTTHEWPNMGEEAQAVFLGILDGEMTTVADEVKKAERNRKSPKSKA